MTDFAPLDTFRATDPADDPARSRRILVEFRARIATMPPDDEGRRPFDPAPGPRPAGRPAHRRPLVALAALALVLVLAGAGALVLSPSHRSGSLDDLALAAATRADATLEPNQYLFVSERSTSRGNTSQRAQWTSRNGSGQAVIAPSTIGPTVPNPPSLTVYPAPGSLDFAGMSYDELRSLPAEPSALLDRLRVLGVANGERPGAQAVALGRLLALEVTPPDVASAAIRALAQLGGVTIGAVPDAAGRVGMGVRGDNDDGTSWFVVVDPDTGQAMAAHDSIAPTAPVAAASGRVWLDQQVMDSLPPDPSGTTHR